MHSPLQLCSNFQSLKDLTYKSIFCYLLVISDNFYSNHTKAYQWHHGTQHNDTQHNDIHNNDTQHKVRALLC